MGIWDDFCMVCGGPSYVPFDSVDVEEGEPLTPPPPNPADYTWLESFVGISSTEEAIPLSSYSGSGSFDTQTGMSPYNRFLLGDFYDVDSTEDLAQGYACHVTCYNLLQQELNYTLKFADVLPLLDDRLLFCNANTFSWTEYGGLGEYLGQCFNEVDLVKDGKLWMIEDPSRDGQNKERILQLWRPLVESGFKRPDERVGVGSTAPEIAEANVDESRA